MCGRRDNDGQKELLNNIRIVGPYVPGEQPRQKVVKLNTNENPYPPAPRWNVFLKRWTQTVSPVSGSDCGRTVGSLADYYGVGKRSGFVGVGSDDVISMCFLTFFNSDLPILFPDITYSFYKVWAELYTDSLSLSEL